MSIDWPTLAAAAAVHNAVAIGVSKRQPYGTVAPIVEAGCTNLGENYLDGLIQRRSEFPQTTMHYIGPIQSRKIPDILANSDYVHSVARHKELSKIAAWQEAHNIRRKVLIQINIGEEPQKNGVPPNTAATWIDEAFNQFDIDIVGLMMIGPVRDNEAALRADFGQLRTLRDQITAKHPSCHELSMGMSNDWQIALDEGATMIRVGQALFGARNT